MRLEGLCEPLAAGSRRAAPRLRIGRGGDGIERLEAHFAGPGFAPHHHDTYAIGTTLQGVQTFRYRGVAQYCLPGEWHVLHPDEIHDGGPATEAGFGYRIVYVDPFLVQQALGGRPLPFVADPVIRPGPARPRLPRLWDLDEPIDDVRRTEIAAAIADMLLVLSAPGAQPVPRRPVPLCLASLGRIRDLIAADPAVRHAAACFEAVSGLDRWTVARQFRAAFGTSPSGFRTRRQLDRVRRLLGQGTGLAEAAAEAGFADQSHMSRQFKRTYGLTPARWATALR